MRNSRKNYGKPSVSGGTIIVFIHKGGGWYLSYSARQAASASPECEVTVLGGRQLGEPIKTVPLDRYAGFEPAAKLRKSYRHMHTGDLGYERFCFLRWFLLLALMEESGAASALYLDSDVLLYSSVGEIVEAFSGGKIACGLSVPAQRHEDREWHVSGHTSFWTRDALREFCSFVLRSFTDERYLGLYREKWDWVQRSGRRGGVSDMTALYLFWREHRDSIANIAEVHNGAVIDHNINLSLNYEENEYEMMSGRKRVEFVDGKPMLVRRDAGTLVRAHALHLQGGAKNFIPLYYCGVTFDGKTLLDSYAVLRRIGQRGKRLVGR